MTDCPFCGGKMVVQKGLPGWLNPQQIMKDHPMPLLGRYVAGKIDEGISQATEHVTTKICAGCGFVAFFTKSP